MFFYAESVSKYGVHLSEDYKDYGERTDAVNKVLEDLRAKDVIGALQGWRDEVRETPKRVLRYNIECF